MYKRKCPKCEIKLEYKSEITLKNAERNKTVCRSCRNKGKNNPFYGKKHKSETIKNYSEKRIANNYIYQTEKFRETQSINATGEKIQCMVEVFMMYG